MALMGCSEIPVYVYFFNEFMTFRVQPYDTFKSLKVKILKTIGSSDADQAPSFYNIVIHYFSIIRNQKSGIFASDDENVLKWLKHEETVFPGLIFLTFIDLRDVLYSPSYLIKKDLMNPDRYGLTVKKEKESSTEWVNHQPKIRQAYHDQISSFSPVSLAEGLFWQISNLALLHGKLQKKINIGKKHEAWREQFVVLETSRIWFFSSETLKDYTTFGCPSFIPLIHHIPQDETEFGEELSNSTYFDYHGKRKIIPLTIKAYALDQLTFCLSIKNIEEDFSKSFSSSISSRPNSTRKTNNNFNNKTKKSQSSLSDQEVTIFLKAKVMEDSQRWVHAINNINNYRLQHGKEYLGGVFPVDKGEKMEINRELVDNDIFNAIEEGISERQKNETKEQMDYLTKTATFEGMLSNRFLRGYFRNYLMSLCAEESLLFWEYTEDFRRGHPFSPHPFPGFLLFTPLDPSESSTTGLSDKKWEIMVLEWAEMIFNNFIRMDAPYQISEGSREQLNEIVEILQKSRLMLTSERDGDPRDEDVPPFDLFVKLQQAEFNVLKNHYFADFSSLPHFCSLLQASVHAAKRSSQGLNLLSTVLKKEVESPLQRGLSKSDPKNKSPVPSPVNKTLGKGKESGFYIGKYVFSALSRAKSEKNPEFLTKSHSTKDEKSLKKDFINEGIESFFPAGFTLNTHSWRISKVKGNKGLVSLRLPEKISKPRRKSTFRNRYIRASSSMEGVTDLSFATHLRAKKAANSATATQLNWLPDAWWDFVEIMRENKFIEVVESQNSVINEVVNKGTGEPQFAPNPDSKVRFRESLRSLTDDDDLRSDQFSEELLPFEERAMVGPTVCLPTPDSTEMILSGPRVNRSGSWNVLKKDHNIHVELLIKNSCKNLIDSLAESLKTMYIGPDDIKPSPLKREVSFQRRSSDRDFVPDYIKALNQVKINTLTEDHTRYQPFKYLQQKELCGAGTTLLVSSMRCKYFQKRAVSARRSLWGGSTGKHQSISANVMRVMTNTGLDSPKLEGTNPAHFFPPQAKARNGSVVFGADIESASYKPPSSSSGVPANGHLVHSASNPEMMARKAQRDSALYSSAMAMATGTSQTVERSGERLSVARSLSDEFVNTKETGSGDTVRQWVALVVRLGCPYLHLYNPSNSEMTAVINLSEIVFITPADDYLNTFELHDESGICWQFTVEGVDEEDSKGLTQRWLSELTAVCDPDKTSIIHILYFGFLSKRGQFNKAFKLRWFVLTSDLRLKYYKDDVSGVLKGEIDLHLVDLSINIDVKEQELAEQVQQVVRFNKEIILSTKQGSRVWVLQADSAENAEKWIVILNQVLYFKDKQTRRKPREDSGRFDNRESGDNVINQVETFKPSTALSGKLNGVFSPATAEGQEEDEDDDDDDGD